MNPMKRGEHRTRLRNRIQKIQQLTSHQTMLDDKIEASQGQTACGFDSGLIDQLNGTLAEGEMCEQVGRCPKHEGWQITKSKDIELSIQYQTESLKRELLSLLDESLKSAIVNE